MTNDYLIAQKRGGGSTIREFIRYNGQVIFYKNSYNYQDFKYNYLFGFAELT